MKTLQILITTLVFSFVIHNSIQAQLSADNTIEAVAEVVQQMEVDAEQNLNFGLVFQSEEKTIDLDGGVSSGTDSNTGEQAGQFVISATSGTSVGISFTSVPANLDRDGGAETLPVSFTSGYSTSDDGSSTTEVLTDGSTTTVGDFPVNDIGGKNAIYLLLGGTVTPAADQAEGTYSGDVTVTATYN